MAFLDPQISVYLVHYYTITMTFLYGVDNQVFCVYLQESCRLVGGSKFYEMMDSATSADVSTPSPTEKHDHMKPTESDDEGDFLSLKKY